MSGAVPNLCTDAFSVCQIFAEYPIACSVERRRVTRKSDWLFLGVPCRSLANLVVPDRPFRSSMRGENERAHVPMSEYLTRYENLD